MSETSAAPAAAAPAGTGAIVAAAGVEQAATGTNAPGIEPGATPASSSEPGDSGQQGEQTTEPTGEAADLSTPLGQQTAITSMKSTLADAGIEPGDSSAAEYVIRRGLDRAPTPEQNVAEQADVMSSLVAIHGKEKAGYMVQWAQAEFAQLAAKNPGLIALAEKSGAGNSIALIQRLAGRGWQRYADATWPKK